MSGVSVLKSRLASCSRWLAAAIFLLPLLTAAAEVARDKDGLVAVPPIARVNDFTDTLSAADKQKLDAKLAAFESAHGAQVAVIMLPSTQPETIADFTNRVGAVWKIGRKDIGDGVLLVVAKDDRKVWISVARALEGAIPDLAAKRVIREQIAPRFATSDFAGGIDAALGALFQLIEGEGLPTPAGLPQKKVSAGEDVAGLLIPFVLVGAVLGGLLKRVIGVPGALVAGGGVGALTAVLLSSVGLGVLAGMGVLLLSFGGSRSGSALGGGRGGPIFLPGGWGGGGGGGGGDGGFSSGGGGDFSGGGAGGSW